MSDSEQGTVQPEPPAEPALPDVASSPFLNAEGRPTALGERWERFILQTGYPGDPHSFVAQDAQTMEKVLVCARPIREGIEWRRRAWAQLSALENVKVLRPRDALEQNGWRYEVMAAPPPMSLQEWIAAHRPAIDEIESLVRQLAATLGALHAEGLVHLNLRPETVHIEEAPTGLEFWLGGMAEMTLFDQPELIPIEVDPFYAPPEAAGLTRHAPGAALCAWDWWSLGRVIQQFMLGHHVLKVLLDRDVSVRNPDLNARAELLLQEKEPPGVRAGAVEQTTAEPAAALPLLRGLLTAAADGRWRQSAVQRWLQHENVADYYDLPRNARLWSFQDRVYTVRTAVEFFTQPENWTVGEENLFHPEQPGTLAHFLNSTPAYRADWERLHSISELAKTPGWVELPPAALRTVSAAAAWLVLSLAGGGRPVFRVRGWPMDTTGLTNLLQRPGGAESVALFKALLSPAVLDFVESLEPAAGRTLGGLVARAGAAMKTALDNGWLDPDDTAAFLRLFSLSLERASALQERVAAIKAAYATSRHPELARLLTARALSPPESLILAFTGEMPNQCGYVTHADARNERYHLLKSEADRIVVALGWRQLHRLLGIARLWGAPWPVFAVVAAVVIGVVALAQRETLSIALVAAAMLLSRAWIWQRVRNTFRLAEPQRPLWNWFDGYARAKQEAERVGGGGAPTPIGVLRQQLQTLHAGMADYAAEARRDPPVPEPRWWDLAAVIVVSATVALTMLVQSYLHLQAIFRHEPEAPAATAEAKPAVPELSRVEHADPSVPIAEVADPQSLLATGKYEVVDDGFGRRLRGPLQKWAAFAPAQVPALEIEARAEASPEQSAFAVVNASLALQPYLRDSVSVILAVRVPTTRGVGVLLFNGRDRRLLDRDVLLVRGEPAERTWYQVDGRRVYFVGSVLALDATISLAPP